MSTYKAKESRIGHWNLLLKYMPHKRNVHFCLHGRCFEMVLKFVPPQWITIQKLESSRQLCRLVFHITFGDTDMRHFCFIYQRGTWLIRSKPENKLSLRLVEHSIFVDLGSSRLAEHYVKTQAGLAPDVGEDTFHRPPDQMYRKEQFIWRSMVWW